MAKRSDGIHKRKDGRWEGRYQKGRKPDGKLTYGSVYGYSYTDVRQKLKEAQSTGNIVLYTKGKEKTFDELLALWMQNNKIRLKKGTLNKYQNLIDTHISPTLGEVKLSKLSAPLINGYLSDIAQNGRLDGAGGLSPSYVRSIMLVINAAIKFGSEEELCPALKTPLNKPSISKSEPKILALAEHQALENYLSNNISPEGIGILIALNTGLRIGEVCALRWEDVDISESIIRVRHTVARVQKEEGEGGNTCLIIDTPKTKSSTRDIPINEKLCKTLATFKKQSGYRYVVAKAEGFISPRSFEYRYHSILKRCGIKDINFHALRHTFATRCIEAGVDVKSLSEILGHANVGITLNTYVHSSMDMKRNQLSKLMDLTG